MIKNNDIDFYQNLGKLFYAIASSDRKIQDKEVIALKSNLRLFLNSENSMSILDMENHIIASFMNHIDNKYDSHKCFEDFINYKRSNEAIFSSDRKKAILKVAGKIASSFSGQNKSELILLGKLSIEFKKNSHEKEF